MKRALALAMIGLSAPAAAAPGPFTYQCTAPFWDSSGLWQMNAGALRRASGRIEVDTLEEIPANWRPDRELRFIGPVPDLRQAEATLSSAEDNNYVSVGIGPYDRSGDVIAIWITWQVGEELGGGRVVTVPRRTGALNRIPFTMVNEGNRVIVEAAGVRSEAPVALGPDIEFRASCQGGEFMFYELDWS